MQALLSMFDIVVDAAATGVDQDVVTTAYFGIGSRLGLDWLRDRILELPRDDRWQALARAALRDDLYRLHRALTRAILIAEPDCGTTTPLDAWLESNASAVQRSQGVLADVRASREYDTTTLPVALRELKSLVGRANKPPRRCRASRLGAVARRGPPGPQRPQCKPPELQRPAGQESDRPGQQSGCNPLEHAVKLSSGHHGITEDHCHRTAGVPRPR